MGYVFQGEVYCDECGEAIIGSLGDGVIDTGDSNDYPQIVDVGNQEADTPQHCGSGAECRTATIIEGKRFGYFFANPLTGDGLEYVRTAGDGPVSRFWRSEYGLD